MVTYTKEELMSTNWTIKWVDNNRNRRLLNRNGSVLELDRNSPAVDLVRIHGLDCDVLEDTCIAAGIPTAERPHVMNMIMDAVNNIPAKANTSSPLDHSRLSELEQSNKRLIIAVGELRKKNDDLETEISRLQKRNEADNRAALELIEERVALAELEFAKQIRPLEEWTKRVALAAAPGAVRPAPAVIDLERAAVEEASRLAKPVRPAPVNTPNGKTVITDEEAANILSVWEVHQNFVKVSEITGRSDPSIRRIIKKAGWTCTSTPKTTFGGATHTWFPPGTHASPGPEVVAPVEREHPYIRYMQYVVGVSAETISALNKMSGLTAKKLKPQQQWLLADTLLLLIKPTPTGGKHNGAKAITEKFIDAFGLAVSADALDSWRVAANKLPQEERPHGCRPGSLKKNQLVVAPALETGVYWNGKGMPRNELLHVNSVGGVGMNPDCSYLESAINRRSLNNDADGLEDEVKTEFVSVVESLINEGNDPNDIDFQKRVIKSVMEMEKNNGN